MKNDSKIKNIKKYLDVLKPFVYFIAIHFLVAVIWTIVISKYVSTKSMFFDNYSYDFDKILDKSDYFLFTVHCVGMFFYYKWYKKLMEKPYISHKKFSFNDKINITLCAIGKILINYGILYLIVRLVIKYFPILIEKYNKTNQVNSDTLIIYVICLVITAPLVEELLFRGVILSKAKKIMPFYLANIFQSFLFALFHMELMKFIHIFLAGLLYGYITRMYGTIKPVIYMHALNNAVSFIVPNIFNKSHVSFVNITIAFWSLIIVVGICFVFIFVYNTRGKNKGSNEL